MYAALRGMLDWTAKDLNLSDSMLPNLENAAFSDFVAFFDDKTDVGRFPMNTVRLFFSFSCSGSYLGSDLVPELDSLRALAKSAALFALLEGPFSESRAACSSSDFGTSTNVLLRATSSLLSILDGCANSVANESDISALKEEIF
ncbi:hypothetical protein OGAPHI_005488 [Ogataea philodendri]|uniref:Uncharacterized protein n=1 Tax=Ogataea philodendri TaxID=1378263 RepID=A0A9P8T1S6_9ASCO|nr:uncharacterized protein OGAPHI_005488 [Ogataea philodendri]KAH3662240.1 hypothetical protein OGAPHI_005488 [Ogataea philodendri]